MTTNTTYVSFVMKAAGHSLSRVGERKMALSSDSVKPVQKTTVSWFEFLFDTTGDVLKKHLGDISAG